MYFSFEEVFFSVPWELKVTQTTATMTRSSEGQAKWQEHSWLTTHLHTLRCFFFPFFRLAGGTSLTRLPPLFFGPWMRRGCCLNECAMLMHFFCNNARHKKHCLLLWAPRRIATCEQVCANGISLALVCVSDIGNWRRGKRNAHFPNSSASKNLLISHLIAKPKSNYPNCNYNSEQRIN